MACITFLVPMVMATTERARAICYEDVRIGQSESTVERNSLRMSWVVATDSTGKERLRMRWTAAEACRVGAGGSRSL